MIEIVFFLVVPGGALTRGDAVLMTFVEAFFPPPAPPKVHAVLFSIFIFLFHFILGWADGQLLPQRLQRRGGVRLLLGYLLVHVALRRYCCMDARVTRARPHRTRETDRQANEQTFETDLLRQTVRQTGR